MYLIELIVKNLKQVKQLTQKKEKSFNENPSEGEIFYEEKQEYKNCEHIFMPIDSTNETLSCTKCGFLVKRGELKKENFFMQNKSDDNLP